MSLILDALKKLDREKLFRKNLMMNIGDEILKMDPARPRKKYRLYFGAVSLTALATAAITYALIVNLGFLSKPSPSVPVNLPGISEPVATAPLSREPVREAQDAAPRVSPTDPSHAESRKTSTVDSLPAPRPTEAKQQVQTAVPSRKSVRESKEADPPAFAKAQNFVESAKPLTAASSPAPRPIEAKQPGQRMESTASSPEPAREAKEGITQATPKGQSLVENKKPSTSPVEKLTSPNAIAEKTDAGSANTKKTAETSSMESSDSSPPLRLTGIVWSEEPSGRCAVINGAIISEGAVIQGVKVVEIFPNRVRLLHNGRSFEIQLF